MAAAAGVLAGAGGAGTPSAGEASAEELSARFEDLARENAELREQNA